jgi:hypothetical protein
MANKGQMTGMLGVYLSAVELVRRGFIVSPTSRSAMGADLLVTDQDCKKAWSVQVKTNSSNANFWLAGKKALTVKSKTHIYIFVSAPENKSPSFFVVPSTVVAKNVPGGKGSWYPYYRDKKFENNWKLFGDPRGPLPPRLSKSK